MQAIERNKLIGASEISSLMGLNPWCTPLKLWALKTGRIEPDDETEYAEWGNRLEEVVARKFSEKHQLKLMAYKKRFVHKTLPYLSCELDRVVVGTDELVEIKTVGAWAAKGWDKDEIPTHYVLQVQMQLGLSGRKKAWFAVLCGGQKYMEREIIFDQELYDKEVHAAINFWETFIQGDVAPIALAEDSDVLLSLFPQSSGPIVDISEEKEQSDEVETALEHRLEILKEINAAENEKAVIDSKIKQIIGGNAGIRTSKFKITWENQSRTIADIEALKKDGIFNQYSKTTVSRTFRVFSNKKEK